MSSACSTYAPSKREKARQARKSAQRKATSGIFGFLAPKKAYGWIKKK